MGNLGVPARANRCWWRCEVIHFRADIPLWPQASVRARGGNEPAASAQGSLPVRAGPADELVIGGVLVLSLRDRYLGQLALSLDIEDVRFGLVLEHSTIRSKPKMNARSLSQVLASAPHR